MKHQIFLLLGLFLGCSVVPSCKNETPAPVSQATTETQTTEAPNLPMLTDPAAASPSTTTPPAPTEPPQNASGVWHYTCPKGCKKGGGAATPCATCGVTLVHNTAYHGAAAQPSKDPVSTTPSPTPTPTPEPAQNKAGVWHYTCADGCAGGAGSASPCAKCSKTLVHNTAYHQ
jgi:hypothetical protein